MTVKRTGNAQNLLVEKWPYNYYAPMQLTAVQLFKRIRCVSVCVDREHLKDTFMNSQISP